jgi:hypothetical protein
MDRNENSWWSPKDGLRGDIVVDGGLLILCNPLAVRRAWLAGDIADFPQELLEPLARRELVVWRSGPEGDHEVCLVCRQDNQFEPDLEDSWACLGTWGLSVRTSEDMIVTSYGGWLEYCLDGVDINSAAPGTLLRASIPLNEYAVSVYSERPTAGLRSDRLKSRARFVVLLVPTKSAVENDSNDFHGLDDIE